MKKTQIIDLVTTIKGTVVSFFSILMFVMLGVGVFLGMHWMFGSLSTMGDAAMTAGHAHDMEIVFPYGLTDDDLAQLKATDGVSEVETGYVSYRELDAGNATQVVKLHSLPGKIDTFISVEGTLPEDETQVALEHSWAKKAGYAIGDTISFLPDDAEVKALKADSYTVTALVSSPAYLSVDVASYGVSNVGSGEVNGVAWLAEDAFDASAFQDAKPYVVLRCDALEGLSTFSEEYRSKSAEIEERVSDLGEELATKRFNDILQRGTDELTEGQRKLTDAEKDLLAGRAQADQAAKDLEAGKETLASESKSAQAQLADAQAQLEAGQKAYDDAQVQLSEKQSELDRAKQVYEAAEELYGEVVGLVSSFRGDVASLRAQVAQDLGMTEEELNQHLDELGAALTADLQELGIDLPYPLNHSTVDDFLNDAEGFLADVRNLEFEFSGYTVSLNSAPGLLADAQAQLDAARQTLSEKGQELEKGKADLAAARERYEREMAEGQKRIEEGEKQLAEGQKQLEEGAAKIDEKRGELQEGWDKLLGLREYRWTVLQRCDNGGVTVINTYATIMQNLRWSMASLFVIVGLFVCYSAVSRIVHEQSSRIGTKKALGFRQREVMRNFLLYSGVSVVIGSILAVPLAMFVVELLTLKPINAHFIPDAQATFYMQVLDVGVMAALELALIGASTWIAVRGVLKRQAVELLAGERPPTAKERFFEKWAIWKRMGLLAQTTVNNCINDTRRVVATLIGVAGCTALVVTAITLNDNVMRAYARHYSDVYHFDTIACLSDDEGVAEAAEQKLEDAGMRSVAVLRKTYTMKLADRSLASATVTVPFDKDEFSRFYELNFVGDTLDEEGVAVSQAFADHRGAKLGDTVELTDSMGNTHDLRIVGFFEYHLSSNEIVMSEELYEKSFNEAAKPNKLLVDSAGQGADKVASTLVGTEGYQTVVDDKTKQDQLFGDFSSLSNIMVAVYLGLAGVMALVVLLNLDLMFIAEKKRELIVLMINGFSVREAKGYIWHDSVILTALGVLCGLALGYLTGGFTVSSVETSSTTFMHDISWLAVGVGVGVSVALSSGVLIYALRKIGKFDLTDINRF